MNHELIFRYLQTFLLPVLTGVVGWAISKWKTSREKRADDVRLVNESISPLLASITELTDTVRTMTERLMDEQRKNLALLQEKADWLAERSDLMAKIEELEKKVQRLTNLVQKLNKNAKMQDDTTIATT